ncbi:hypothetical protein Hs30E_05250 [Lactococcus hodotermopsidis]|uniref:Glycosyltransferase 2-like domain-containing protein n=1 Tax=Pseudolactococcus hodotermopsidis TaxID=2709157 RepID=A0A6A0BC46_9LACT|nr:glycosyltransferase family 2 protein [Lactococcus hodotermopsidis]GFH41974.1 hypothetical protein Hs30E_05250 [Lactococcus hodotermopsidis]
MIDHLLSLNWWMIIVLFIFVFYPIVGGIFWIVAGAFYHFLSKGRFPDFPEDITPKKQPFVTIMLPCHNEEVVLQNTLYYLTQQIDYDNYEILAISDGSTDTTNEILRAELQHSQKLRVINVEKNAGKAHALTQAALHAKGEFLLCIDADSFVTGESVKKMLAWFLVDSLFSNAAEVGAVTGNPTPRNRSSLLGKLQFVEYNSIIGLTKRAQSMIGRLFTVSGVCVMYRKSALIDVGFYDQRKITEDIAVSWRLQLGGWRIQYAPNARCYMQVPEDIKTLYKQRRRWAQGGFEVFLDNAIRVIFNPLRTFPQLVLLMDSFVSIMWAIFWAISSLFTVGLIVWEAVHQQYNALFIFIMINLIFIAFEFVVGIIQLTTSLVFNDSDRSTYRYIFFAGWYTWLYWLISPITLIAAIPRAFKSMFSDGGGTWVSPVRDADHEPAENGNQTTNKVMTTAKEVKEPILSDAEMNKKVIFDLFFDKKGKLTPGIIMFRVKQIAGTLIVWIVTLAPIVIIAREMIFYLTGKHKPSLYYKEVPKLFENFLTSTVITVGIVGIVTIAFNFYREYLLTSKTHTSNFDETHQDIADKKDLLEFHFQGVLGLPDERTEKRWIDIIPENNIGKDEIDVLYEKLGEDSEKM